MNIHLLDFGLLCGYLSHPASLSPRSSRLSSSLTRKAHPAVNRYRNFVSGTDIPRSCSTSYVRRGARPRVHGLCSQFQQCIRYHSRCVGFVLRIHVSQERFSDTAFAVKKKVPWSLRMSSARNCRQTFWHMCLGVFLLLTARFR
jgi:hypothetical protein